MKEVSPRHYTLGYLFQKLILHSHNRIFKLHKLLKARNTFSHKIKPKKLKNKSYFWVEEAIKNMIVNTAVQSESCIIRISENIQNYWMFLLFTLKTMGVWQTKKTW